MPVVNIRPQIGHMMYRDFWEAGIPVFPIYRFTTKGKCECGHAECDVAGKHPRATSWQHTPIWDDDQLEAAEQAGHYDTGYGVLCRGLLVVDVDARNGGNESYRKLIEVVPSVAAAGLAVSTGSGGGSQHLYFRVPQGVSFVTHHADYPGIDFKSSGYVVGPGSAHVSGGIYTADGSPDDIADAPDDLVALLRRPERHRSEYDGHAIDLAHADIADMLAHIPNDDVPYEEWISIGMAIHHATQGTGFDLWRDWSATSSKHDARLMDRKWYSFGKSANPVTAGTLVHHATQGGWSMPVTFSPDDGLLEKLAADPEPSGGMPFDISGVDLTQPPGFVGDVARWIDSQGFRPRRRLAAAAALVCVGNIGGLRYIDDTTRAKANIFAFCIAGSGTGKDAVLSAAKALHKAAGIYPAVHGGIKSEQEMVRNLLEHQASFYLVDEVAALFSKIKNAKKSGNAAYLEAIPQKLMEAYSDSGEGMAVSGDVKRQLRTDILKEISTLDKRQDIAQDVRDKLERRLKANLARVAFGIVNPFVSFMGVTVPHSFAEMVDYDMATNGFIGRSLIFNEREQVPEFRKRHKKPPLPDDMAMMLRAIWTGGEYDSAEEDRVENEDNPIEIASDAAAHSMLDAVSDWMQDKAREASEENGLQALYMRGYEMVAKVSLILAIPGRLRTAEHVRWAFSLVNRDISDKAELVVGNDDNKGFANEAMSARLLSLIGDEEQGVLAGALVRDMKRSHYRKEDVLTLLDKLVAQGTLTTKEGTHPKTKAPWKRYFRK